MEFQLAIIGAFGTMFGIVISFFSFNRNRDKDVKNDAEESSLIRTKLDNIGSGIESVRVDMNVDRKREWTCQKVSQGLKKVLNKLINE